MPLYEEKLICPLAVRFTQDHIRPKFKDGRELGESVHQIQTKPGFDGYDFLLEAPFPHIEIIRWSQLDTEATEANADHWFTLDNRRLYCLQHVAASLWPKKCAVRVEVLYAACHGIKKKDTSCTVGRKVVIKHSDKHAEKQSDLWDWRAAVQVGIETRLRRALRGIKEEDISWAHEFVACEDKKATTEELLDAPEVSSPLGYAASADDVSTDIDSASTSGKTSSDSSPRVTLKEEEEEEDMSCNNILSQDCDILSALQSAVKGSWTGNQAESYDIRDSKEEATWTCVRWNANGSSKKYTLWYDAESNCISWGLDWSYYVDASEFLEDPASLQWYRGSAKKKDAPIFRWHRATRRASSATSNHSAAGDASTDIDSASASGSAPSDSSPRVTPKEEEAMPCNDILNQDCDTLSALRLAMKGSWTGNRAESYDIRESEEEATWTCVRWNANGSSNKYTLWYDAESNCISWGRDWSYYVDASEFLEDPASLQWYRGSAKKKDAPVFRWHRATRRANSATSSHSTAGKLVSTEQTEACLTWYPSKRSSKTYQSKAQTKVQGQRWAVTGK